MDKQPTCEQRIESHLESRMADLTALWKVHCAGEQTWDELCSFVEKHPKARKSTAEKKLSAEAFELLPYYRDAYDAGGYEGLYEYGLCFDYVPWDEEHDRGDYFRWQFSWGGPSDELRFHATCDLKLRYAEYWFMDWFDGAHRQLRGDNLQLARELFSWFEDAGSLEHEREKALAD